MSNFLANVLAACPEPIQWFVIGEEEYTWDDSKFDHMPKGEILIWDESKKLLDFEYDSGFGSVDGPAIFAWSENYVVFSSEYDGAQDFVAIPRNPTNCMPRWL